MNRIRRSLIAVLTVLLSVTALTNASAATTRMYIERLWASDFRFNGASYAGKKDAMITIAERLMNEGFEPAFAAGVMANVACEGSFGKFENVWGYTETRLLQVFTKLKPCSETGNDHQNYVAHIKGFTTYDRCGHDHSEYATYSNKYLYNGFSLKDVEAMITRYKNEGWTAKFGLGSIQWTGGRTATLFSFYKSVAAGADTITKEQCGEAEMQMIVYELKNSYKRVYTNWTTANENRNTEDAAYDAGYRVCYYYEVPSNRETSSQKRGNIAKDIYNTMMTVPTASEIDYSRFKVITLPQNTESVRSQALAGTAAEIIVIPKNCKRIAADAFDNCSNLIYIVNHSSVSIIPPVDVTVIDG